MAQKQIVNIPIAVEFRPRKVRYEVSEGPHGVVFEGFETPDQPNRVRDPWRMRDEFFRVRQGDNEALLRFLHKWGSWATDSGFLPDLFTLPAAIWADHKSFREVLTGKLGMWLNRSRNAPLFSELRPRSGYPPFLLSFRDCGDAIRTTITIDLLNQMKFGICSRPDCGAPYAVESDHARKYCTQYCGHLESLRRKRREARDN